MRNQRNRRYEAYDLATDRVIATGISHKTLAQHAVVAQREDQETEHLVAVYHNAGVARRLAQQMTTKTRSARVVQARQVD